MVDSGSIAPIVSIATTPAMVTRPVRRSTRRMIALGTAGALFVACMVVVLVGAWRRAPRLS